MNQGQRSLGDVARAANLLRGIVVRSDELMTNHNDDGALFLPGSQASREYLPRYRDATRDALGFMNLFLVAMLDHGDALAAWGESAARNEPTPTYPPWSVARSLIEAAANAAWLAEQPLSIRARVARMLMFHRQNASRPDASDDDRQAAIAAVDAEAAALHIPILRSRNRWLGYEEQMPSMTVRVGSLLQLERGFQTYSMLSAASHGEIWAIQELGYVAEGEADSVTGLLRAVKKPPAFWLWTALRFSAIAVHRSIRTTSTYRGWI